MRVPFKALRMLHLALTPLLGAFVYSPTLRDTALLVTVVQLVVFPAIAGAGLLMWLGRRRASGVFSHAGR